jgi:aryl-alcohol dehydrogenase-like predicted oxidoreductase
MRYRLLGRTDLSVSEICLGSMTWGCQNSEADAHAQIDYALGQGVNFIDTAELYAVPPSAETQGRTEEYIGSWLAQTGRRDDIVLASKVTGPGIPWIRGGQTPIDRASIAAALDSSLKRLRTDRIDLYQLHWPNRPHYHFGGVWKFDASRTDAAATAANFIDILETLRDLVTAGKIRHIGLSNESAWGLMKYLALAESRDLPRMASIQNEYNLTCRIFEPDLAEACLMEDVGLLAYSPLSTGAISGKYLDGKIPPGSRRSMAQRHNHRANPVADAAIADYIALADKHGLDVCQMAIAFACAQPFMASVIIGATNMDQLKTNIAAKDIALSADVVAGIAEIRRRYPVPY